MYIRKSDFPYKKARPKQISIINNINKANDKKYIILESETGVGKSAIGVAACKAGGHNGYLITSTKQLQDQYFEDFYSNSDPYIGLVKGRNNYRCGMDETCTCNIGPCREDKKLAVECAQCGCCDFLIARDNAISSRIFLTSYDFFFGVCLNTTGKYKTRSTLVFDECHLLEEKITNWMTCNINLEELNELHGILDCSRIETFMSGEIPVVLKEFSQEEIMDFTTKLSVLLECYIFLADKKLASNCIDLSPKDNWFTENGYSPTKYIDINEFNALEIKEIKVEELKTIEYIVKQFLKDNNRFKTWLGREYGEGGLTLIPLDIKDIFKNFISKMASDKIIFMSGSILDIKGYMKTFGLDKKDTAVIRCTSDFDPSRSPIYSIPVCKMNYKSLEDEENLKKIAEVVNKILEKNKDKKGIIHTGNMKISKYLKDNLNNDRLLVRLDDITNGDIVRTHISVDRPTVLVSSSMAEGVDLKDDLSRFQIVVKLPFGSLKDDRTAIKFRDNEDWYVCEMFKKLIQQCGRSTRNAEDYSETYVLDSSFKYYINSVKPKGWLSNNFINRIKSTKQD